MNKKNPKELSIKWLENIIDAIKDGGIQVQNSNFVKEGGSIIQQRDTGMPQYHKTYRDERWVIELAVHELKKVRVGKEPTAKDLGA